MFEGAVGALDAKANNRLIIGCKTLGPHDDVMSPPALI